MILVKDHLLAPQIDKFNDIDFCAIVAVSYSNAYQYICNIHTIYYHALF